MKSAHVSLSIGTVRSVVLAEKDADYLTVHLRTGTAAYFTIDGSTPAAEGSDTYVVHTNFPVRHIPIVTSDVQTIKLVSDAISTVSVEAW